MATKIQDVLKEGPYPNWDELHKKIAQIEGSTTSKGDAFEQFSYFYLLYHKNIFEIEEVWCDKVPGRKIPYSFKNPESKYRIRDNDEGTDLITQLKGFREPHEAYQAKFRSDYHTSPSSQELRTFWNDSHRFESRRIITSSIAISRKDQDSKYYDNTHPPICRGDFLNISDSKDFFKQLHSWANDQEKLPKRVLYKPKAHQKDMVKDVVEGFNNLKTEDQRGKLIAACGTGKTLAALWIAEHSDLQISNLLFLAPTIELTAQTFREWAMQRSEDFDFLIVCSDKDASTIDGDHSDISVSDLGVKVTTDTQEISNFLEMESTKRKYIFSTYQSSDRIREAFEIGRKFESFDLIIFDEAHRTASKTIDPKGGMQVALDNDSIKSKRRLFMTATERIQTPKVKKYLEDAGKDYFSMDDEAKYGKTFHSLSFGKAINKGLIADYQIILAACDYQAVGEEEFLDRIVEVNNINKPLTSLEVYQALFVSKLLNKNKISKALTFQNSVDRAQAFSYLLKQINGTSDIYIDAVWGEEGIASRREKKSEFGLAKKAVLSNVRCLSEGVDLPMIDSVIFCDDRSSPIDLIQAIGRALRKKEKEKKVASILIPVPIPSDIKTLDGIDWDNVPGMTTFHEILQAMRDQDRILNEEIDDIIVSTAKGKIGKRKTKPNSKNLSKILIVPPTAMKINLHDMWDKIGIRISDANFRKKGETSVFGELGKSKGDRKSTAFKLPIFGDYSVTGAFKNECLAVLEELSEERVPIAKSNLRELAINSSKLNTSAHNTAAMLAKIGIVKEIDRKNCIITSLGLRLKENPDQWDKAVINQALIYSQDGIYPYRLVLEALLENKGVLNYHEFLFGISQIETIGTLPNLQKIDQTIKYLRKEYPDGLTKVPDGKHGEVIAQIVSEGIEVNLAPKDIWSTKTTQGNKWIYLKSVMSILPFVEAEQHKIFIPNIESVQDLKIALFNSKRVLGEEYGSDASWWNDQPEEDDFSFG